MFALRFGHDSMGVCCCDSESSIWSSKEGLCLSSLLSDMVSRSGQPKFQPLPSSCAFREDVSKWSVIIGQPIVWSPLEIIDSGRCSSELETSHIQQFKKKRRTTFLHSPAYFTSEKLSLSICFRCSFKLKSSSFPDPAVSLVDRM
jgi:hypothetical protein